jgi:hypothetical protein
MSPAAAADRVAPVLRAVPRVDDRRPVRAERGGDLVHVGRERGCRRGVKWAVAGIGAAAVSGRPSATHLA